MNKAKNRIHPSTLGTQTCAFSFRYTIPDIIVFVYLHTNTFYIWRNTAFLIPTEDSSVSYLILSSLNNASLAWSVWGDALFHCIGFLHRRRQTFPWVEQPVTLVGVPHNVCTLGCKSEQCCLEIIYFCVTDKCQFFTCLWLSPPPFLSGFVIR